MRFECLSHHSNGQCNSVDDPFIKCYYKTCLPVPEPYKAIWTESAMNNANLSVEIMFPADFCCGSDVELLGVGIAGVFGVGIVVGVFATVEGLI